MPPAYVGEPRTFTIAPHTDVPETLHLTLDARSL